MQTDFWLERWEQNQIGFHEKEVNDHLINFWGALNILPESKVFVPFCGKSRDMLWLLAQGYEVLGVELSPIAVKSFFSENDLEPRITNHGDFQRWEAEGVSIYLGNFFDLNAEDLIDCSAVYDRASLIALPPDMRQRYVDHLRTIAHVISQTLLVTLEYDQSEMQGPPFSVNKNEIYKMFGEGCDVECLLEENALDKNDHFIQKGLTCLLESVYLLNKR